MDRVVEATRSPMNPNRWLVRLDCGHETWVTSVRKPKRVVCAAVICNTADAQAQRRREARR